MLTVLIPTHGRPSLLKRTLEFLTQCKVPESYCELVVIENGSSDGAEDVVDQLPAFLNVRYLHYEAGNKSAALNYALETIQDDLIVFFDDDVRLSPNVLIAYESASQNRNRCFVGGPTGADYEEEPLDWILLPASVRGWKLPDGTREWKHPDFLGFNWAAYGEDIIVAGGFNPIVGPGGTSGGRGQETTMQSKLLGAGLSGIYTKDALVHHFVPKSRCSIAWSRNRIYQNWITVGLSSKPKKVTTLFGYARWTIPQAVTKLAKAILVTSLSRSPQARYDAWKSYYEFRGYMEGLKRQSNTFSDDPGTPE